MNELAIKTRIALLRTRPSNNDRIISKLERKLRALNNTK
jgi:hypothetical protein